jgi:arginine/lysine/ornithine decarboxylase
MSSFHTPGHKNNFSIKYKNLLNFDFTELDDTDNLYDPRNSIDKAQNSAAKFFHTEKTLFSANGNTLAVKAMIAAVTNPGDEIIITRNIHKSVMIAVILLDLKPIWVYPEKNSFNKISKKKIEILFKKKPNVKALLVTSPDYYGVMCDIKELSSVCKKNKISLLVDNAHGTHLACFFPEKLHPAMLGADLCADSAHKTLPVLTSGAFLHVINGKYKKRAKDAMSLFGSTSPSFPVLTSLDLAVDWMKKNGRSAFLRLKEKVKKIRRIANEKGIPVLNTKLQDPARIVLGISNKNICKKVFSEFKVQPEIYLSNSLILIVSPFNRTKDFLRLKKVISRLKPASDCEEVLPEFLPKQEIVTSPRESYFADSETRDTQNTLGKISAKFICPCPPGIPIVMPGERVNQETLFSLANAGIRKIRIVK